jgi:hypothetical protein
VIVSVVAVSVSVSPASVSSVIVSVVAVSVSVSPASVSSVIVSVVAVSVSVSPASVSSVIVSVVVVSVTVGVAAGAALTFLRSSNNWSLSSLRAVICSFFCSSVSVLSRFIAETCRLTSFLTSSFDRPSYLLTGGAGGVGVSGVVGGAGRTGSAEGSLPVIAPAPAPRPKPARPSYALAPTTPLPKGTSNPCLCRAKF